MTDARGMSDILIPLGRLSRLWADYCRNWAKMAYYYNVLTYTLGPVAGPRYVKKKKESE